MRSLPALTDRSSGGFDTARLGVFSLVLAVLLVGTIVPVSAASAASPTQAQYAAPVPMDEETVLIELESDGDARVTLVTPFDLRTEAERQAFERLQANQTATSEMLGAYRDRMAVVANRAADRTGRTMSVQDPAIALTVTEDGSRGFIRLSVMWTALAAVEGDRLTVDAPFDNGFTSDAQFVVVAPDGAELVQARPSPTTRQGPDVEWAGGSDLSGFELTYRMGTASTDDGASDGSGSLSPGGQAGFGPVVVLLALLAIAIFARRSQR